MKFSKPVLILSVAGLGLTLAYSQQSNSEAQQKAVEILRQQLAGQGRAAPAPAPEAGKAPAAAPTKDQLLADVERLHTEGKITDEQYATFKKNINEQYAATGTASSTQALAQAALAQKIQQLKTAPPAAPTPAVAQTQPKPQPAKTPKVTEPPAVQPAAVPPSNTEAQAKAQKVLDEQLAQQRASQAAKSPPPVAPKAQAKSQKVADEQQARQQASQAAKAPKAPRPQPAAAPTPAVAAAATAAAAPAPAATRTPERTNVIPATAYSTLSPQQEAEARELLRQKIAESNAQTGRPKPAAPAVPAGVAAAAPPVKAAPPPVVVAPAVTPAQPPPVAPAAAAPAVVAQPAPDSAAQAKALATLREYDIGITPDTPEPVKILRLKIAELDGLVTPEEAAGIPVATKFYGPSPWAAAATSPRTAIPFPTSNKEGLARLSELNSLYLSNLISPGDYHHERAKIVATL